LNIDRGMFIPLTAAAIVQQFHSRYAASMANRTITRPDIITALNEETELPKATCSKLLEGVLNEITDTLANGEKVKINGFATFKPHQKHARTGRNVKTGEEVPIPPRKVIVFRPSGVMRGRINGTGD
jgi:integration host factor subunit alpha